ncbi:MAG TPA: Ig-like domain-containing protein [Pyrinomonadaceae bacterium]|nr:Ig-like domain-containing protein [Pyrinomonadaceae bacterium]
MSFFRGSLTALVLVICSLTVVAQESDLGVSKFGPDSGEAGVNVTYTITFVNGGPDVAPSAVLTDDIPAGLEFVSLSSPPEFTCTTPAVGSGGTISCNATSLTAGVSLEFTLVLHVPAETPPGTTFTNTATASGDVFDPNDENNSGSWAFTTSGPLADMQVIKSGPSTTGPDSDVPFVITMTNNGPTAATNASFSDNLPTGMTFVSFTQTEGPTATCMTPAVGDGGLITCSIATLGNGASASFALTVHVGSEFEEYTNQVSVTSETEDPNEENNISTAVVIVTSADLGISKTGPGNAVAGETISWTLIATNSGPSPADILISDALPAGTTFHSVTQDDGPSGGCLTPAVGANGLVTCGVDGLPSGDSATFTLTARVQSSVAANTQITNTATVSSDGSDPNTENNTASSTFTVTTLADVSVVKTDSPDPVGAGSNLTYSITVTNNGSSDSQSLSLSDTLPANTTLVSFTVPAGWTRTDVVPAGGAGTVTATATTLAAGSSSLFTLIVNVNSDSPIDTVLSNTVNVNSATSDPNSENNSDTETTAVIALPNAVDDLYAVIKNQVLNVPAPGVLSNDTGPSLTLTPVVGGSTTAGGTYTLNSDGSFAYTPPAGFSGTDGFDYTISNPAGSDTAHVTIAVNDPATTALRISEFRFNGPNGSRDEFFEIFNPSPTDHVVGATSLSNSGGYGLFASAGNGVTSNTVTLVCLLPNGTVIPARGYVLCTGGSYSLAQLGSVGSSTGSGVVPAINGIVPTALGNFPVINGTAGNPGAFTSADVPNDAGLVLANVGSNTVGASADSGNGSFGFNATGVGTGNFTVFDRVGFAPYGSGAPLQPCHLVIPAGCGVSGSARPSLADSYCESTPAQCLRPVGDASTTNHGTQSFYGDSGQYSLLRRQTTDQSATIGTIPQDTANSSDDILMVSPVPGINIAFSITNFATGLGNGLVSVLGAAGPQNNAAPADLPETRLQSSLFDLTKTSTQLPNAERRYVIDNTNTTINNNPIGSFIFRFGFRNTSTSTDINRLRFRVDNLSVPCGQASPAPATAVVGSGNARNLSQTAPNCQGTDNKTAVLKMLNLATELVSPENGPAAIVRGSVIEDTNEGTQLAPNGGGVNNSLVRTGSEPGSLTGEFTTVVPAGSPGPKFFIGFRMGVVKGGSFRFLFQPEGSSGTPEPSPTVAPVEVDQ